MRIGSHRVHPHPGRLDSGSHCGFGHPKQKIIIRRGHEDYPTRRRQDERPAFHCRHRRICQTYPALPTFRHRSHTGIAEHQKEKEADLLLKAFQPGDHIVLLDEHGREHRSVEFAAWMEKRMAAGLKRMVFVVGGPYGFSPRIYAKANEKVSLSRMTFSHQMIRLIFTEQIYRAMTIINGEPYHHE